MTWALGALFAYFWTGCVFAFTLYRISAKNDNPMTLDELLYIVLFWPELVLYH